MNYETLPLQKKTAEWDWHRFDEERRKTSPVISSDDGP